MVSKIKEINQTLAVLYLASIPKEVLNKYREKAQQVRMKKRFMVAV